MYTLYVCYLTKYSSPLKPPDAIQNTSTNQRSAGLNETRQRCVLQWHERVKKLTASYSKDSSCIRHSCIAAKQEHITTHLIYLLLICHYTSTYKASDIHSENIIVVCIEPFNSGRQQRVDCDEYAQCRCVLLFICKPGCVFQT